MPRRTPSTALVLIAISLAACGCGEAGPSHSTGLLSVKPITPQQVEEVASGRAIAPTAPLAGAQLIARADPICQAFNAKRAPVSLGSARSAAVLSALASYEWSAIAALTNLTPPASMASDWRQTLNDLRTIAETTAAVTQYVRSGQPGGIPSLVPVIGEADRKLHALAASDGVTECV